MEEVIKRLLTPFQMAASQSYLMALEEIQKEKNLDNDGPVRVKVFYLDDVSEMCFCGLSNSTMGMVYITEQNKIETIKLCDRCLQNIIDEVQQSAVVVQTETCWNCRKKSETKMKVCGRCKIATFCNKSCQKEAWPEHKKKCSKVEYI